MAYYYGDLNIAMLKNCKREPLDLSLEVIILQILSLNYIFKLNIIDLYHVKILKFYYNLCCNRLPQYFSAYHNVTQEYNFSYNLRTWPLRLPFT